MCIATQYTCVVRNTALCGVLVGSPDVPHQPGGGGGEHVGGLWDGTDARGQRPFVVIAPVQTDKTKESMVEVAKEILGIASERPIKGEEFDSIMRNMVSRLPGRFETLASLEGAATSLVNYGYPPEYFYNYGRNVRQVTQADLAAAAARFIHPERVVWIVVGDLAKIEAGVRELGYGEIVHLDADGTPIK